MVYVFDVCNYCPHCRSSFCIIYGRFGGIWWSDLAERTRRIRFDQICATCPSCKNTFLIEEAHDSKFTTVARLLTSTFLKKYRLDISVVPEALDSGLDQIDTMFSKEKTPQRAAKFLIEKWQRYNDSFLFKMFSSDLRSEAAFANIYPNWALIENIAVDAQFESNVVRREQFPADYFYNLERLLKLLDESDWTQIRLKAEAFRALGAFSEASGVLARIESIDSTSFKSVDERANESDHEERPPNLKALNGSYDSSKTAIDPYGTIDPHLFGWIEQMRLWIDKHDARLRPIVSKFL